MTQTPPSLGAQIAGLHNAVRAQEECAWIPDAIHTLIMAILARIFGQLEQLILRWQAGELALPKPPAAKNHQTARTPRAPSPDWPSQGSKRFFLKKEAKTSIHWHRAQRRSRSQADKSFLVLFFKKEPFLPLVFARAARRNSCVFWRRNHEFSFFDPFAPTLSRALIVAISK